MYKVEFTIDECHTCCSSMGQSYRCVGSGERIRVKKIAPSFVSQLEKRDFLCARSPKPFIVIIVVEADGAASHLNGEVQIVIATNENGDSGASVYIGNNRVD